MPPPLLQLSNIALTFGGTPLLAGPGAIAATIVFVRQAGGHLGSYIAVAVAIVVVHLALFLVLRFSGQKIDDRRLMQFSARFGELDHVPIATAGFDRGDSGLVKDAEPWVAVISSVVLRRT